MTGQNSTAPPVGSSALLDARGCVIRNDKCQYCYRKLPTMEFYKQGHIIRVCDDCGERKALSMVKGHSYILRALSLRETRNHVSDLRNQVPQMEREQPQAPNLHSALLSSNDQAQRPPNQTHEND